MASTGLSNSHRPPPLLKVPTRGAEIAPPSPDSSRPQWPQARRDEPNEGPHQGRAYPLCNHGASAFSGHHSGKCTPILMPETSNHRRLAVRTEDLLHCSADLPDRCVRTHGLEDRIHRILIAPARLLELLEALFDPVVVAALLEGLQAFDLALGDRGVYAVELDVLLVLGFVDVDVDHVALFLFELALVAGGGIGDLTHREALLNGLYHAPHLVYLPEVVVGLPLELVGQRLDEVGSSKRIDGVRNPGLQGGYLLGPDGDPDGLLRREGEGLVQGVCVQALRTAQDGGERLEGGAGDVVVRLLGRQGDARSLGVEAHPQGPFVFRAVLLFEYGRPDTTGSPEFADLLEEIYVRVKEEAEAR